MKPTGFHRIFWYKGCRHFGVRKSTKKECRKQGILQKFKRDKCLNRIIKRSEKQTFWKFFNDYYDT